MNPLLSDLYGESSWLWSQVWNAAQGQLFWIAAIVAAVCLTPNKTYGQIYRAGKKLFQKFFNAQPTVTPAIPVVTPSPGIVVDPTKIKTSQDLKKLYDDFRKSKQDRIAELKALLAKEEQELRDLDVIQVVTPTTEVTP